MDSIVAVLDALAEAWLDDDTPERQRALEILPRITGTSAAMIRESIDLEQASSRADHMDRALRSEFGNPAVPDGFVDNPLLGGGTDHGRVGPTSPAVFSSNIPALPHLTAMRSLLVKSILGSNKPTRAHVLAALSIGRRSDSTPTSPPAQPARPGKRASSRSHFGRERLLCDGGGPEAEAHSREAVPPETRFVFHGHRIGLGDRGRRLGDR